MMDILTSIDVQKLLYNKFVAIVGDSGMIHVDSTAWCVQNNKYLAQSMLKQKDEPVFRLDELIEGGKMGVVHIGKSYREVRQYQTDNYLLRYYYITRCYSDYIETILLDFENGHMPDVFIVNSCVWDITRIEYKKSLQRLFSRLKTALPESCLCLWLTTLPIGSNVSRGFLLPELDFYNATLRFDIVISNFHAQQVDHNINILGLHHHHFRQLTNWRKGDGIHWGNLAHRRMTQLILTHVCECVVSVKIKVINFNF